jgi:hypothetical protein
MNSKHFPPKYLAPEYNCPRCGVFASQAWFAAHTASHMTIPDLEVSFCTHCKRFSLWVAKSLIFPDNSGLELPNEDLPEDILRDYSEAASIVQKSPRGAAALLRLAIQKLCAFLGGTGDNINADIAMLVEKGLSIKIQQALDIVRVIGNDAVHPGTIDLKDDAETASKLFGLINLIADAMISQPKHVDEMYKALPLAMLKGIEERDRRKPS